MISYSLYNKILNTLYDYTKRQIWLDGNAIEYIINSFVLEFSLQDYIKKIKYINDKDVVIHLGGYNFINKIIFLNYDDILTGFINKNNINYRNSFENAFKVNLHILNCVLHEIFHAIQYKKVIEGPNTLEKLLLKISFETNLLEYKKDSNNSKEYFDSINMLYKNHKKFYSSTPSEHMANIVAADLECSFANDSVFKVSRSFKKSEKLKLLKAELRDYDFNSKINSPTMNYLKMKEDVIKFKNFVSPVYNIEEVKNIINEQYNNLCLNEKLYYGLELNKKEKSKLIKKY